jgi:hypothetical protein
VTQPDQKRLLYRSCVVPVITYGFCLWYFKGTCVKGLIKAMSLFFFVKSKIYNVGLGRSPWAAHTNNMLIGSPHRLNSEFAFYTHSEQYPNVTTHFRILFHIFIAYFASLQLIRTSEAHFGNFGPILDLRSLFQKLRIYFGPPKIISETSHL